MKIISLFLTVCLATSTAIFYQSCVGEVSANTTIDTSKTWQSVEDAATLSKVDNKKILVDVYTDWCRWCKVMDEKTFQDPAVKTFLSDNYHLAKLNAEQKEDITLGRKVYKWTANGRKGNNRLAIELLDGQLSYPSLVVLDQNLNKVEIIRGYKSPEKLMAILKK